MKEIPVIFTTELIPKILDLSKTNTRRLNGLKRINESPNDWGQPYQLKDNPELWTFRNLKTGEVITIKCPYGQVGDRLWCKETYAVFPNLLYKADFKGIPQPYISWQTPLFMPHALSRITLEITGIRAERLQEITVEDMIAEGINDDSLPFKPLWDSLNAKRGYPWDSNPWVWVIDFKKL